MAILKCQRCGGYNSPSEWPEEERGNFTPDLCFNCFRNTSVDDDAKEEEPEETDADPDGLAAQEEADKAAEGDDTDE